MRKHLRLLPVVLFAGGLMLTVKVGGLWSDLSVTAGAASSAEETPPAAAEALATAATTESASVEEATPPELAAAEAPETAGAPTVPVAATPVAAAGSAAEATASEAAPAADTAALPDPFDFTDEEIDVLQSLSKRREELDAQERALQQREALLAAAEQRIDQKLTELKGLQETIGGLMKQHDEQAQAQLKSLVKIYENMKPKDAARIFEQLEMDVLLDVVAGMKEQKVSAVLAQVDPVRARDITLELAARHSLPIPTE